ncbi:MAG: putative Ig domain-containing protein [Verrucomicrobia bacterium]|nr:putative Ig domain-containing protein [Verrucomicrobiota bacterium]
MKYLLNIYSKRNLTLLFFVLLIASLSVPIQARPWRPDQIPNGNTFRCQNCHLSSNGGGSRNAFGNAVFSIVRGGTTAPFWSPALAALDSDGDGFTNGEELGDPDGDGIRAPGVTVTNPGSATSKPAPKNTAPTIASAPVTSAAFGLLYQYQLTAQDPEGNSLTYSKEGGPDWLSVSAAGLANGTPPENATGEFTVSIQATDNGSPAMSATQSFSLNVIASFSGWQNLRFAGATQSSDAAPGADPDNDGLSNLAEYLLRSDPRAANSASFVSVDFNASGQLTLGMKVRTDDSNVKVSVEFASDVGFGSPTIVSATEVGVDTAAGFRSLSASDTVSRSQQNLRFARVRVTP